jgi:hypothetical protein
MTWIQAVPSILFGALAAGLIASCGDDPESSLDETDTTLCETNGVSTTIANNHPNGSHVLTIPVSDVQARVPVVYDIQGNNTGHGHTVSVSVDAFDALESGMIVSLVSSDTGAAGNDHTHAVTLSCNP